MVRSRDQTPSPPRHRRWGRASRTSPPASSPPPSPHSPAASSESSSPERVRTLTLHAPRSHHVPRTHPDLISLPVSCGSRSSWQNLSRLCVADLYHKSVWLGRWCDEIGLCYMWWDCVRLVPSWSTWSGLVLSLAATLAMSSLRHIR